MLKLLSKLFRKKPPTISYADEKGLARMSKMRRKTMESAQLSESVDEHGESTSEIEGRKDILSKARDMEIETYKGYMAKDEQRKKSRSTFSDLQKRVNHLTGFEVDPQF